MQKQKNKETGITLIALVVSIIVLIILAGVSMAMLVGENGIITQAQRAKENTELAETQEKEDMDIEFQKLKMETVERAKDFSFSYEEYMKSNVLFRKIITREKTFLEETHGYIEMLEDNFSNRKEYILYCDAERKSLELINRYLELLI